MLNDLVEHQSNFESLTKLNTRERDLWPKRNVWSNGVLSLIRIIWIGYRSIKERRIGKCEKNQKLIESKTSWNLMFFKSEFLIHCGCSITDIEEEESLSFLKEWILFTEYYSLNSLSCWRNELDWVLSLERRVSTNKIEQPFYN